MSQLCFITFWLSTHQSTWGPFTVYVASCYAAGLQYLRVLQMQFQPNIIENSSKFKKAKLEFAVYLTTRYIVFTFYLQLLTRHLYFKVCRRYKWMCSAVKKNEIVHLQWHGQIQRKDNTMWCLICKSHKTIKWTYLQNSHRLTNTENSLWLPKEIRWGR